MTAATLRSQIPGTVLSQAAVMKPIPDIATVLATIDDWEEMTRRLLAYARYRTSRYGRSNSYFQGRVDDYVQDAVALFLEGRRHYDPNLYATPLRFFCATIDSLVSHDAEKKTRRKELALAPDDGDETPIDAIPADHLAARGDVERELMEADDLERFIESTGEDLQRYLRLRRSLDATAAQFAELLGIPEAEIRSMDRRIRRRRIKWLKR